MYTDTCTTHVFVENASATKKKKNGFIHKSILWGIHGFSPLRLASFIDFFPHSN